MTEDAPEIIPYSQRRLCSVEPVKLPQDHAEWQDEFNASVAPSLDRPPPIVRLGYAHLKGRRSW